MLFSIVKAEQISKGTNHYSPSCSVKCHFIGLFPAYLEQAKIRWEPDYNHPRPPINFLPYVGIRATNGFSMANLLGSGTFGSVYKGNLDTDRGNSTNIAEMQIGSRDQMLSVLGPITRFQVSV
jgi:hypothetical protein